MTAEIADSNILPVDGFGRIKVELNQSGHTSKTSKTINNFLGTFCPASKLLRNTTKSIVGFPGEDSLEFNTLPLKRMFSTTGVKRVSKREVLLRANLVNRIVRIASGTALMTKGVTRDVIEVHRMLCTRARIQRGRKPK